MTESRPPDPPSPFVEAWATTLSQQLPASARALDVAMGRGRHALLLAQRGFRVFGVDRQFDAVRDGVEHSARRGFVVRGWCADLNATPLPRGRFDLIVVTRYLQRDLFPSLGAALAPGGVLLYETFTEAQRAHGRGPTSSDHLLKAGELPTLADGLETIFYAEVAEPDCVARLVARRRSAS